MKKSKAKIIACLVMISSLLLFMFPVIVATIQYRNLQFILFNGYNSEQIETSMGTLGITAEVEAYRDLVTEYAVKYEIEDYVGFIFLQLLCRNPEGIEMTFFRHRNHLD